MIKHHCVLTYEYNPALDDDLDDEDLHKVPDQEYIDIELPLQIHKDDIISIHKHGSQWEGTCTDVKHIIKFTKSNRLKEYANQYYITLQRA